MKNSRFKFSYRASASKAHKEVGNILRTNPFFKGYSSYQEYPVSKVNVNYNSNREHFDWVVPGLKLVIEVMGRQHEYIATFGGISKEEAMDNLKATQYRDKQKENAAILAGWTYITIPWNKEPTAEYILEQYKLNYNDVLLPNDTKESTFSIQYSKIKDKLKSYRKQQYKRLKEYRKQKLTNAILQG